MTQCLIFVVGAIGGVECLEGFFYTTTPANDLPYYFECYRPSGVPMHGKCCRDSRADTANDVQLPYVHTNGDPGTNKLSSQWERRLN